MENKIVVFRRLGKVHTFSELIEGICDHPRMFTRNGTFAEASAWLQGFAAGLSQANADLDSEWRGFIAWLPQKLKYPSNFVWFSALQHIYLEDEVAFEQLRLLFAEYRATDDNNKDGSKTLAK